MAQEPKPPALLLRAKEIAVFDRGNGVATTPYVGKWNSEAVQITTGVTAFSAGTAIPLHTHNVDETVLVLEGTALAVIGEDTFQLAPGDATWVPAGMPHRFLNQGQTPMRIYWVYGGRQVTRTMCDTGVTVEHLSEQDRGATSA